jgi:hypothetical protein
MAGSYPGWEQIPPQASRRNQMILDFCLQSCETMYPPQPSPPHSYPSFLILCYSSPGN